MYLLAEEKKDVNVRRWLVVNGLRLVAGRSKSVTFNTIHYGENIHHFPLVIFGYLLFFKFIKNIIGISGK